MGNGAEQQGCGNWGSLEHHGFPMCFPGRSLVYWVCNISSLCMKWFSPKLLHPQVVVLRSFIGDVIRCDVMQQVSV